MKLVIPPKPTGETDFAVFCKAVWDKLWGGKFPFKNTDTVQWSFSPSSGYEPKIVFPKQPAPGGGGINPRLEFDPTATYNYLDMVFISSGSNQGTFLYINAAPSLGSDHPPYAGGNYWVEFPSQFGAWL